MGIKMANGVLLAVEERNRRLQTPGMSHKIFQVDDHLGVAAAGYIPDARIQVDQARVMAQSSHLIYDEPVDVETISRKIADMSQQFTQFAGVRPFGVSLIVAGVDKGGSRLFLTDPSGTYVGYDAVAIGAGSDQVTEYFEQKYQKGASLEDATVLAIEAIYLVSEDKEGTEHIKIAMIDEESSKMRLLTEEEIQKSASKVKAVKAQKS